MFIIQSWSDPHNFIYQLPIANYASRLYLYTQLLFSWFNALAIALENNDILLSKAQLCSHNYCQLATTFRTTKFKYKTTSHDCMIMLETHPKTLLEGQLFLLPPCSAFPAIESLGQVMYIANYTSQSISRMERIQTTLDLATGWKRCH